MQFRKLTHTIVAGVLCTTLSVQAQMDTFRHIQLNEVVTSANKFAERKKNIAQQIQIINRPEIEWSMSQTTASLVEQTGNVFVQRSQAGGGSAVIRGFEASRIIMMVDGVRMNNAIYRAGHLQNIITIDNNILDKVEIMNGSASTLYGSDALGGVIIFNTKAAKLSTTGKADVGANAMLRYSSANNEQTGHVDINLGFKKFVSLTSLTYSKFGDVKQGSFRNPFYGNFGMRDEYVERINNNDSIVANTNPHVQKFSGYHQIDLLQKFLYQQNEHVAHSLNIQYSNSSDIPRYDRLTDRRSGQLRYAEWYYGPQRRNMVAYNLDAIRLNGIVDEIKAGVNYQSIEESRYQRDRGKNDLQNRIENLDIVGYHVDFRKFLGRNELTFGTDGQFNNVATRAFSKDVTNSTESPLDTRYPDGGSTMYLGALYAQHIYKIIPDKLVLNDGIRLNYVNLNSLFNDTAFYPFPFKEAKQQHLAWSGNLGMVYMPANRWRFSLNGSTGFRSPNVDDMAKVFESAGGTSLVVPNPDLKPEYTYNADLGITYVVDDILRIESNAYYTWFRNAIVTDAFTLNGADSIQYNGSLTAVMASQNKARAYLYGFNVAMTARLMPAVTLYSTINFTYGRYMDALGAEVPLDHIPPVYGKTSIMYKHKRFGSEVYALYNGWKRLSDYSPSGEDNLNYATPFGMPAWVTLNIRTGYQVNKYLSVELALENLLDYNYRAFASGISAPGRNFVASLRGTF